MNKFFKFLLATALVFGLAAKPASAEKAELEIGYMPILPVSQLFVMLEEGWVEEAGAEAKLVKFQNGPSIVQALLAGQLDVAYFGIGPAMVARGKGADIKVVASNIIEQIGFISLGELTPYFENGPASTAFSRFRKEKGRKAVITTFPVGSVPETVLQYWLRKQLGANVDDVDVIYQGAAQVQQAMLTGAVDAAAILEPVITLILGKIPEAKLVASGSEMFPNQPGAVFAVREGVIARHPEIIGKLVHAHARATDFLNSNPSGAAPLVQKWVSGGRLPVNVVEQSIRSSEGHFVADPNRIVDGTKAMHDFQAEIGTLKAKVALEELFDTGFYDAVKK